MTRIVTAREQADMLVPWLRHAMPALYRGMDKEFNPSYDVNHSEPAGYDHWTDSKDLARSYAGPSGHVYQYDLPDSAMGQSYIDDDGERPLYYHNMDNKTHQGESGTEYLVYHDHDDYDPNKIKKITYHREHSGIIARNGNGEPVGYLTWWDPSQITSSFDNAQPWELQRIEVHPDYQRRGIATCMMAMARRHEPRVHHSPHMTAAGAAWAKATGYAPLEYVPVSDLGGAGVWNR